MIHIYGIVYDALPPESDESGKPVIAYFDNSCEWSLHAMTFVGYNDSIKYDINGDGEFRNDMDNNNDGLIDMRDWEVGALKAANSWGTDWPNQFQNSDGFIYCPYRIIPEAKAVTGEKVFVVIAEEEYSPELAVKANVHYPEQRYKLRFKVGYANNANNIEPFNTN